MEPKIGTLRSVADAHQLLVLQARWELFGPSKFPSPPNTIPIIEIGYGYVSSHVNHFCLKPKGWESIALDTPVNVRSLPLVNVGSGDAGIVAVAQCGECGRIYWERIVCRRRSREIPDFVCSLPRYHGGPCNFVHHSVS